MTVGRPGTGPAMPPAIDATSTVVVRGAGEKGRPSGTTDPKSRSVRLGRRLLASPARADLAFADVIRHAVHLDQVAA